MRAKTVCAKGHVLTDKNVGERRGKQYCMDCIFDVLHDSAEEVRKQNNYFESVITPEKIIEIVSIFYHVPGKHILGKGRTSRIVAARQVSMYLTREFTTMSFPEIGRVFGEKHHTTVLSACKRVAERIKKNKQVEMEIGKLSRMLRVKQQTVRAQIEITSDTVCLACGKTMVQNDRYRQCDGCGYTESSCV